MMIDRRKVAEGVRLILEGIGEDPARPGLVDTPERVAELYAEIFGGIGEDPSSVIKVIEGESHHEMVLVRDLPFHSMCEHHLLPFQGKAHVAYIPSSGRIIGIGNIGRLLDSLSRRPQVQERLTTQLADTIERQLAPLGTMVVIAAEHTCLSLRGARKEGSKVVTSAVRGIFRKNATTRQEMLSLIRK
jgi:GTP cyclohydrolase I